MGGQAYIYLDHAATTPMRPEAVEAMLPYLSDTFANPSGSHAAAREARRALDDAREQVAEVVGVGPGEVVFTSGGTESDVTAITGAVEARIAAGDRDAVAVCAAAEHHAVLHPVEHLGGRVVAVDAVGRVDLDALAEVLDEHTAVVSVMAVNNEVGTITDLDAVAAVVREHAPTAVMHTDAVQAVTWLDLRPLSRSVDSISLSAHKFGGPKGVGVLTVAPTATMAPLLLGGGQERDRRSGTHNVAGIVATAVALEITDRERSQVEARVRAQRDRLVDTIVAAIPDVVETVPRADKVAGSAHLCLPGIESEALLFLLDRARVCASAASACASGAMDPSHVLAAMGIESTTAGGALRLSLGHTTTDDDVDAAAAAIIDAVVHLREWVSQR